MTYKPINCYVFFRYTELHAYLHINYFDYLQSPKATWNVLQLPVVYYVYL